MATPGPSATPDLQLVAQYVRSELGDILDKTPGPKDIVIQQELMTLLNHIASVKFLKSHEMDKLYRLAPQMRVPGYNRYYIVRPEIGSAYTISSHINKDMREGVRINYNIVFVPRNLACCDYILEREGVLGQVLIHEWNLYLIPLDEHILSLEIPDATQALYLHGDYTLLHSVAQSVLQLEVLYGGIKTFQAKGVLSCKISDLLGRLREAYCIKDEAWGSHDVSELIMIDRSVDLVTPLCSQMTYEGMLDDTLGICNGFIHVTKATTGRLTDTKVLVNSTDPVFKLIRGLLFSKAPIVLSRLTRELKGEYDSGKGAREISDLKAFVSQLPELKKKHESLSTHLRVSEKIVTQKKVEDFKRQLGYERAILECQDATGPIIEYIEECIQRQVTSLLPIRLLCLLSLTSGGIKSKYYQSMKLQYLQSYGYNHLSTFYTLEQLGLLRERTGDQLSYQSSFKQFNKALRLVPKYASSEEMEKVTDMSYVFGGAYLPLGCMAVKSVIENGNWKAMEDISKMWKGPTVSPSGTSAAPVGVKKKGAKSSNQGRRTIIVYFVGGCTFSEINALQYLGQELNCRIVVATTNIISATTLLECLVNSN